MEQILSLIDDLIEMEKARDAEYKAMAIKAHKASQSMGESGLLFHLKALRELAEKEKNK